jgi:GNAT superfamily N-acetyltransferase
MGVGPDPPSLRRIRPDDWQLLRDLRLRGLEEAPYAFGSTLARELARRDAWWRKWAREDATGHRYTTVLAFDAGRAVGMAGGYVADGELRQVVVVAVWVAPVARRGGAGRALLGAVEAWAAEVGASSTSLSVTDANPVARAFYVSCGYEETGATKPLARDRSIREISMRRRLAPPAPG